MKILAIGNSFSQDSMTYAHQLCEEITVVNAFYGGCTNEMHCGFFREDNHCYEKQVNGRLEEDHAVLRDILQSDTFDFVLLGTGTSNWKKYGEVPPNTPWVEYLFEVIAEYQPNAKIGYHRFWPDGVTSNRSIMNERFGCDRAKMFGAFQTLAEEMSERYGIRYILPCGDAVNAAYGVFGEKIYRDGFHMSEHGRYLLGCLYTEYFTGREPDASFIPNGNCGEIPNEEERKTLRKIAHDTVAALK